MERKSNITVVDYDAGDDATSPAQGQLLETSLYERAKTDPLASAELYFNVVSDFPEALEAPSFERMNEQLRNRCTPNDPALWNATPERKAAALTAFADGYLPIREHVYFAMSLTAAVAECAKSKSFGHPRNRRLYYAHKLVINGKDSLPARPSLDTPTGRSFVITGLAGAGRTAFCHRLRTTFGPPMRVVPGIPNAPPEVFYFPTLYVPWPEANTVEALIESIQRAFDAELRDPLTEQKPIFASLKGKSVDAAVAVCSVMNVGLFILDGANAEHVSGDFEGILSFLLRLGDFSVPTLLSCSEAFLRRAGAANRNALKAVSGRPMIFRLMEKPPEKETLDRNGNPEVTLFEARCQWYWKQGFFGAEISPLPRSAVRLIYDLCLGRDKWLMDGFRELHESLVRMKPQERASYLGAHPKHIERLQGLLSSVFEQALYGSKDARRVIRDVNEGAAISSHEFLTFMDHFPRDAAESLRLEAHLKVARGRR